jgi:hypothetical protein
MTKKIKSKKRKVIQKFKKQPPAMVGRDLKQDTVGYV